MGSVEFLLVASVDCLVAWLTVVVPRVDPVETDCEACRVVFETAMEPRVVGWVEFLEVTSVASEDFPVAAVVG